jgi:uncharacterized protein YpiB (UPF0302 family)
MIEVLNQLTHKDLADYSLFEKLLGEHFEKFRFFYKNTCYVPKEIFKNVKTVSCFCTEKGILVEMDFKGTKNRDSYLQCLEGNMDISNNYSKYFKFSVESKGKKNLNILIENKTISREDEIHEDRFNTC